MAARETSYSYYDASRRVARLHLMLYAAIDDGDVVAAAVAYARFLRVAFDPFVQVDFWREVLTNGLAATLEDGLRGALDAMIEDVKPAEKEAR